MFFFYWTHTTFSVYVHGNCIIRSGKTVRSVDGVSNIDVVVLTLQLERYDSQNWENVIHDFSNYIFKFKHHNYQPIKRYTL